MGIEIRFVGGPADGRTLTIPDDSPPPLYLIPEAKPLAALFADPGPSITRAAEYEPLREDGWPRREDDGAYLYAHRPAAVTPEERRALEQTRQEAKAADERRTAETDAAWREVRKERPDFPGDWRDLF